MRRNTVQWIIVLAAVCLYGCSPKPDLRDLRNFTTDAFRDRKPEIEPLPKIEPYESFIYSSETLTNPFSPDNLREKKPIVKEDENTVFQPERRREVLEQFPLDAILMRGTLFQDNRAWALVGSPDGGTHRVTVGNHMGRQNGKIIEITETDILLREVIKGPSGNWQERKATLSLVQ
jgi:type IV pilus assembly protein PilP